MGDDEEPENVAADFAMLISSARAEEAARSRTKERNLRASAAGDATLAGILVDLAEAGSTVAFRTVAGRTITGVVTMVAIDAVVVEATGGGVSYIRMPAIAVVRRTPARRRGGEPAGDRPPPRKATFAALVGDLARERPRVGVVVTGETRLVTGELRAAGTDVLTMRLDGDPPVTAHLAVAQVSEVVILASG